MQAIRELREINVLGVFDQVQKALRLRGDMSAIRSPKDEGLGVARTFVDSVGVAVAFAVFLQDHVEIGAAEAECADAAAAWRTVPVAKPGP